MRFLPFTLLALAVVLTGCPEAGVRAEWQASLQAQPGFEGVSGNATAARVAGQTVATAVLSGASPNAVHPWHIHTGTCATGGPILGSAQAYPPLTVNAAGMATASATISPLLDAGSNYHVNVHASPEDLATIVACGNLSLN